MNILQTQTDLTNSTNAMNAMAFGVGQPSVTLTIRLIMQGKEVGSIIGKKGDNIKRFREESGAKITISDGSCPERIVTVTGSTEAILKAFALIARKFEEENNLAAAHANINLSNNTVVVGQNGKSSLPVTLKLIVPASQCGSLIGKGGSKIKEIRETTGACIQVASEMLPNSTERAVTLSGSAESITKSIYQICCVMLESPPKGPTIPYRPKPAMPPVFFAGGQAYTIQGQFAIPHPDAFNAPLSSTTTPQFFESQSCALQHQAAAAFLSQHFSHQQQQQQAQALSSTIHSAHQVATQPQQSQQSSPQAHQAASPDHTSSPTTQATSQQNGGSMGGNFLDLTPAAAAAAAAQFGSAGFLTKLHRLALQHAPLLGHTVGSLNPQAATLASLANSAASMGHHTTTTTNAGVVPTLTTEMTIPNDIIGSVIGKGGAKINEIRQLSGATIKINNSEEGSKDRTVIISGTAEAINLAQYLIATRVIYSEQFLSLFGQLSACGEQQQPPQGENVLYQYYTFYKNYIQPYESAQPNGSAGGGGGRVEHTLPLSIHHHHHHHPQQYPVEDCCCGGDSSLSGSDGCSTNSSKSKRRSTVQYSDPIVAAAAAAGYPFAALHPLGGTSSTAANPGGGTCILYSNSNGVGNTAAAAAATVATTAASDSSSDGAFANYGPFHHHHHHHHGSNISQQQF